MLVNRFRSRQNASVIFLKPFALFRSENGVFQKRLEVGTGRPAARNATDRSRDCKCPLFYQKKPQICANLRFSCKKPWGRFTLSILRSELFRKLVLEVFYSRSYTGKNQKFLGIWPSEKVEKLLLPSVRVFF